jgi:hypothetical protein
MPAYRDRLRALLRHARERGHAIVLYRDTDQVAETDHWPALGDLIDYAVVERDAQMDAGGPGGAIPIRPMISLGAETRPVVCLLAVTGESDGPATREVMGLVRRQALVFSIQAARDIEAELNQASIQLGAIRPRR